VKLSVVASTFQRGEASCQERGELSGARRVVWSEASCLERGELSGARRVVWSEASCLERGPQ
jgi:hypothetical protein